jgi:hypothetical protein
LQKRNSVKTPSPNEHIAKIAALPSSEKLCYFRGVSSLGSAVEAATSPSRWALAAMAGHDHPKTQEILTIRK